MINNYGPYWGMHIFWWAFWIFAMVSVFGFNVPERTRYSLDPHTLLRRRFARGQISEEQYVKYQASLRSHEESVRREIPAQSAHTVLVGHPFVDGLSFSLAWAVLYSLCSLLYWIAPELILTATSKLFHGMSFTQMAQAGSPFGLGDFVSVLTLGAIYTFVAGIVWSLIHTYFHRLRVGSQVDQNENRIVQKSRLSTEAR